MICVPVGDFLLYNIFYTVNFLRDSIIILINIIAITNVIIWMKILSIPMVLKISLSPTITSQSVIGGKIMFRIFKNENV
jgi:hypothetical protein